MKRFSIAPSILSHSLNQFKARKSHGFVTDECFKSTSKAETTRKQPDINKILVYSCNFRSH